MHSIFSTNTYILVDTCRHAAIIFDAPGRVDDVLKYLNEKEVTTIDGVFFTHGHVDHVLSANELKQKLPQPCSFYLGEEDLPIWKGVNQQIEDFGVPYKVEELVAPDVLLKGGEKVVFGGVTIECIHSPGHSLGSMVYYVTREGASPLMVTGDVLFERSVGRTDWSNVACLKNTSSSSDLKDSLNRLEKYPQDVAILTGHGNCSTLGKALRASAGYL